MIKLYFKNIFSSKITNFYHKTEKKHNFIRDKLVFEIHLVEHCNLNCKGCDNFSPLAEKEFTDINIFNNDFKRLSEIFNNEAERILLLGGEPLLHPQINEFLSSARKYFPSAKIELVTNGMLLLQQNDQFWKSCKDNNIVVMNTKYPINLDFDKIEKLAASNDVIFKYFGGTGEIQKTLFCLPMDLEGKQDVQKNFIKCHRANNCISLVDGKLFTCTIAPNIRHFNKYFNKNLIVSEHDYIDIYKAQSKQQILKFLSKPIPFCKYCNIEKTSGNLNWEVSKKDIKEWSL